MSSLAFNNPDDMAGQLASFLGYFLPFGAIFTSIPLVRLLIRSALHLPGSRIAHSEPLPETYWADNLEGMQRRFQEKQDTGLPPGLVIEFNDISIYVDERKRWRDRTTKRFVRGPRKGLEGATLIFYGRKIVPAGFGNNRWRDPGTGRYVKGPLWSYDTLVTQHEKLG